MKKRLTNNLSLKILAFLIAGFMWFMVVNIDDPVSDKTYVGIAVKVLNEEVVQDSNRTYQIVDGTGEVNVTVTAKRSLLNKIKAEDIQATADMKELLLGTQIPIQVTVKGYEGRYESAVSSPRNLQVKIDDETKNNFPITPTVTGTVRDGYTIGSLKADPEKVTIRGPKTVIDSINRVAAEIDVSGLSESTDLEARLVLYDGNDNVIDQTILANNLGKDGVSVKVKLNKVKRVPIALDTSGIQAKEGYNIAKVTPEPKEIMVSGTEKNLESLDEIMVPAEELSFTDLTERTEKQVDISAYLPEGISLLDENAKNIVVSILVEQPGVKIYEVSTSSLTVNNLADGLEVSYGHVVDLELQIQGPEEVLQSLKLAKKASIDLKGYTEPGSYVVPVFVELPAGCALVNEVKADITLEKK